MSRQALPAAFNSVPRKLSPSNGEAAPDLRVLNVPPGDTASEIQLESIAAEEELAGLRTENAELRSRLEQTEQLLHAAVDSEEAWLERHKEFEALLEEKSDVIRQLHQKIQQLLEGSEGKNLARAEELDKIQAELDERRRQLTQDEEALMTQMRTMEMAMSRDRAELARQRSELQRTQAEVDRGIEVASRDPLLRERLASLNRRRQEATPTMFEIQMPADPNAAPPADNSAAAAKRKRGLLSRLFGTGLD